MRLSTRRESAKGLTGWKRWLLIALAAITLLAVGAGAIDKIVNVDALPACDGKRTRDTLSDLNKAKAVNAASYNFITVTAKSDRGSALRGEPRAARRGDAGV